MDNLKCKNIVEIFKKPESNAIYQALIIYKNRIFEDEHIFSTFENAVRNAFYEKPATKAMMYNDETVDFRIRKKYADSRNILSAKVTQTGEILDIWEA